MPLPLPNLDDRTFTDLVEEARALIPSYGRDWTDHNPSDPGITLVELFAYLVEGLIYRADQVSEPTRLAFLRLLNGPEAHDPVLPEGSREQSQAVDAAVAAALRTLRSRFRAVTCNDYELLAREASPLVERAHCVTRRDLADDLEADRPGEVSILIVPTSDEIDVAKLAKDVWSYLEGRRILTTRHHVVPPVNAPVTVDAVVQRRTDVPEERVATAVDTALSAFLDPRKGGVDQAGWPFGRSVYASEVIRVLERVPEIDHVAALRLRSACDPSLQRCVPAVEELHENGDLIGLTLSPNQLPSYIVTTSSAGSASTLIVGSAFVPIAVAVAVAATGGADPAQVARAVKETVRAFFDPRSGGPTGDAEWRPATVKENLRTAIAQAAGVASVATLEVETTPARTYRNQLGYDEIWVAQGELAEVQTTVQVG